MDLFIISHPFRFETENLTRMFIKDEKINIFFEDKESQSYIKTIADEHSDGVDFTVKILYNGVILNDSISIRKTENYSKDGEYALMRLLYLSLVKVTQYTPKWGMLTGIRPTKFYRNTAKREGNLNIDAYFKETYLLSDEKLNLTKRVALAEDAIISKLKSNGYSLYISIPFCPTRCSYCSFVSHSIERTKKLIEPYVLKLTEELKMTADIAEKLGLNLQSVYFGGGTPTTLSAEFLELLMKTVQNNFNLSNLLEYTVEAGRPDTVTVDKLEVIKKYGAKRISINTQTADDKILQAIGRKHTFKEFCEKIDLAKGIGFETINVDLIAGLPGDSLDGFKNSVESVISKNPENVTVHTLAIKRASDFGEHPIPHSREVSGMLKFAENRLKEEKLYPYYMYRQSNSASDLENVGYAKKGHEGIYNILMMNEVQTVIACGAGAVTKLKNPYTDDIERVFNYKFPYEYIDRFNDILNRKEEINQFYEKNKI